MRVKKLEIFPYLLLMPAILMMVVVNLTPIIQGFYMSLLKLNQYTLSQYLDAPFIGLENYRRVIFEEHSPIRAGLGFALRNTLLYTLMVSVLAIVIGLAVAVLLNRDFPGRSIARTLLLLPWIVPSYVVGTLWGFMWQRDVGIINVVLVDWLHLFSERPFWLLGSNSFWAIVIPTVWRAWPVMMLIFLAALQAIPEDQYEAATLDGISKWQQFIHITLPLLKPVIVIQFMFQIIDNIYSYNIVSMMFGNGAGHPGEWADLLMPLLTRQSFSYWLFGQGAAVSFIMMIIMLIFVAAWMRSFKRSMISDE
ncbi:carbohydrate ABC transporter permease [Solimicrobium silvestre]|uniref:ABC-type sugar transport systems permease component n=1 Tax=Solimicrobium silvestre TaxID=2099400 RepID=A0A2S9H459_9BURK|nr:sugar ABC transporter permease [Solimicrobium silvestre]PRC94656.1 ABC-type sugar transport systems permease component [Solimicrobium silvestre]